MNYRNFTIFLLLLVFFFSSCKRNRLKVNVSDINVNLEITRFDQELFNLPENNFSEEIKNLRTANPEFFDLFTYRMINIGGIGDEFFFDGLNRFLTDTMVVNVKNITENNFSHFNKTEKELKKAFQHYRYYFPDKKIPKIYTCISGFNQSVVVAEGLIGASLDKYLGADCRYYDMLGLPEYKQQKMYPARLPVDMMYGWATTEFLKSRNESNLLSHMIHEGKLMYFTDAMFPKTHDTIKIGYTAKQINWCKNNEARMWANLIENKRLFTTDRMSIKRFIDDSPYTNGFPLESPGRAGVWIGWQIVRQYMDKNPEVTLQQLMGTNDSQKILNGSKYMPD